jgi:hypothetical protein
MPNLKNFIEVLSKGGLAGGPHEFVYSLSVTSNHKCDFTFFETHNKHRLKHYRYIDENEKFYIPRVINKKNEAFNRDDEAKQDIINKANPVKGNVFLITDCPYPFNVNLSIKEFLYKDILVKTLEKTTKKNHRNLQLDDGDEFDTEKIKMNTLVHYDIIVQPSLDNVELWQKSKNSSGETTVELPPGTKNSSKMSLKNILKVNLSDKKLQTNTVPSSSHASTPEGFK